MKSFFLRSGEFHEIQITVERYESPPREEAPDEWLSCSVSIRSGDFRGVYAAAFLLGELTQFHHDLSRLHEELKGECMFLPLEKQLELKIACNATGLMQVSGKARDQVGDAANELHFQFTLDQSFLPMTLQEFAEVLQAFPLRTLHLDS